MKSYYITFRSVTFAQRGEKTLRQAGFSCTLQRTPRWMEERGCGYCLRIRNQDAEAVVVLFRENGVPFRKVYVQKESGRLEELAI